MLVISPRPPLDPLRFLVLFPFVIVQHWAGRWEFSTVRWAGPCPHSAGARPATEQPQKGEKWGVPGVGHLKNRNPKKNIRLERNGGPIRALPSVPPLPRSHGRGKPLITYKPRARGCHPLGSGLITNIEPGRFCARAAGYFNGILEEGGLVLGAFVHDFVCFGKEF